MVGYPEHCKTYFVNSATCNMTGPTGFYKRAGVIMRVVFYRPKGHWRIVGSAHIF